MKKSLHYSVSIFGVAGLVLLAGCGNETSPEAPIENRINTQQEVQINPAPKEVTALDPIISDQAVEEVVMVSGEVVTEQSVFQYTSPAGPESMEMSISLDTDRITAISVIPQATDPKSIRWQTAFAGGVADQVIGKTIAEVADLDVISGASLTTGGFKAALANL